MVLNNTLSLLYALSLKYPILFLIITGKGLSHLSTKFADILDLCLRRIRILNILL